MLALPTVGRATPGTAPSVTSCNPFCGVMRFMAPQSRARVQPMAIARHNGVARRNTVRVARAVPVRQGYPRPVYVAAGPPSLAYPRIIYPRYRAWPAVYPGYVNPGYRYVYYYVYPYGYRGY